MIRVPTIPKSRSARVRRHERSGKTLSSTYLDRRLPRRYHRLEHLASLKLVVSLYKTSTVRFSSRPTHFGPKHSEPFNTHRAGILPRFSPIHF